MTNAQRLRCDPPSTTTDAPPWTGTRTPVSSRLPAVFEQNVGQCDEDVRWVIHRPDASVRFHDDRVEFRRADASGEGEPLTLRWVGGLTACRPACRRALPFEGRFIDGTEQTSFVVADEIRYPDIAPGVDLVFLTRDGGLHYEILVGPDADPQALVFQIDDAEIRVERSGRSVACTAYGELQQQAPRFFLLSASGRADEELPGGFRCEGDRGRFGFEVRRAPGDRRTLLIDPELVHAVPVATLSAGAGRSMVSARGDICHVALQVPGSKTMCLYLDCSDPAQPQPIATILIKGMSAVRDIAAGDRDRCYLLGPVDARRLPRTGGTVPPGVSGDVSALMRLTRTGGLSAYAVVDPRLVSIAVDPDDPTDGVFAYGDIDPGSAPPPALSESVVAGSALLMKFRSDLSGVMWAKILGGTVGVTRPARRTGRRAGDGQGHCHARQGVVVITGETTASDLPHTAQFFVVPPSPAPAVVTTARAFIAVFDGGHGGRLWSAALPEEVDSESCGKQVAIAEIDRSCVWLVEHGRGARVTHDALYRIRDDGAAIMRHQPLESWRPGGREAHTGFRQMHSHNHLVLESDATCWVTTATSRRGLASDDGFDRQQTGSRDVLLRSFDAGGRMGYGTYLGGYDPVARITEQTEDSTGLDWADGRLYVVVRTKSLANALVTSGNTSGATGDYHYLAIFDTTRAQARVEVDCSTREACVDEQFVYSITVTNTGTAPLQGCTLRVQAGAEVDCLYTDGWMWPSDARGNGAQLPTLAVGASRVLYLNALGVGVGRNTLQVEVTAADGTVIGSASLPDGPVVVDAASRPSPLLIRFLRSSEARGIPPAVLTTCQIIDGGAGQTAAVLRVRRRNLGATDSAALHALDFDPWIGGDIVEANKWGTTVHGQIVRPGTEVYDIELQPLSPAGFFWVGDHSRALLHPAPIAGVHGTEVSVIDGAGTVTRTSRAVTVIGGLVSADLVLRLRSPAPSLGLPRAARPFVLDLEVSRRRTDGGTALPNLRLNVVFRVPLGTPPPETFVSPLNRPTQLTLGDGERGLALRRVGTGPSGDLWHAVFRLAGATLTPGASVTAKVDLGAILPAYDFTSYHVVAGIHGGIESLPAQVWQAP